MNILRDENFILWVLFMATNSQKTTNYKQIFRLVLVVFLACLWRWGYLKVSDVLIGHDISNVQEKITEKNAELMGFSDKPGYDKLIYVKNLEASTNTMPWSDHIEAIMAIFKDLLDVDKSDTRNITFTDFEISLEKIRLDWYVTNLRILYQGSNSADTNKPGLISKFEELGFLNNISIRTYEKWEDPLGNNRYKFTLTANVINNGK